MDRKTYHHGDLKKELIHNGLLLLNKEGTERFSLRKVAIMCGVSHSAPYKHFKDKDALISEIIKEVWKEFYVALLAVTEVYPNEPKLQIIEMGKAYVKFMVENPECLKFMFLSDNAYPVRIEDDKFPDDKVGAFGVFKDSAERFFKEMKLDENLYMQKTLLLWSMVHGLAILIIKNSIEYKGDYLVLVESMIRTSL
ncbi:TetR/AcrR family transcriptional regulator [Marinisporobacter balticus]|uniref:TetR family transcriptional regulator n=1 Tax=Marinisporobacter balticus TaxID=2018667 RepID=A0A4R2KQ16_9FIRM|nr:TetR/AcrR family transcriptional regulator [Marinisporobacter balticus]TCO72198.1 TetR family transcriptional regulator [Marinisporobacter balticus]